MSRTTKLAPAPTRDRTEDDTPEGWTHIALADVGSWASGGTPSKSTSGFWEGGTIPWVSPKDMKRSFIGDSIDHITEHAVASGAATLVPSGTVLFVVRGMILAHTFPVGLTTCEVAFNQDMRAIQPHAGLHGPYLLRALQHEANRILFSVKEATHGTLRLDSETLRPWPIPVAPLPEQRRIVTQVDALLEQVNRAKARLDRVPLILKKFRQSVIAAACSGELSAHRENVEEMPLAELLAEPLANGRSVPDASNGFPVLRLTALRGGKIDLRERKVGAWTAKDAARVLVKRGDFLISRGNGSLSLVARGGLVTCEPDPVAFPDTMIRIRPRVDVLLPEYLQLVWWAPTVRAQIEAAAHTTAGIHKVSQKDIGQILLPVPSLEAQRDVVQRVDEMFGLADAIDGRLRAATSRAEKLPQAILSKAFSGDLVLTEAELARAEGRTYETAEELLRRVTASSPSPKPNAKVRGSREARTTG